MLRKLLYQHEVIIALILIGVCLTIGFVNPNFWSVPNLLAILRSATIMGIFSLGVLVVLISGGIDVSFTGIAIFSMYTTTAILVGRDYQGSVLLPFIISAVLGLILGLFNGFLIGAFKLPTLIVTLGTLSLFRGAMLFFVGSEYFNQRELPESMNEFARSSLVTIQLTRGQTKLHPTILVWAALIILVWLILRYTMLGRGFYAMGGAREAAERAGFNILRNQLVIYAFVGLISGIGGMTHGILFRQANPFAIVGTELDVIAAVVLGGASIAGGRGTVIGTVLGVFLITIVSNSLVLLGIPSEWQKAVVGSFILIGTGIPALLAILRRRQSTRTQTA
jgi:simple sugar transport system permease protein